MNSEKSSMKFHKFTSNWRDELVCSDSSQDFDARKASITERITRISGQKSLLPKVRLDNWKPSHDWTVEEGKSHVVCDLFSWFLS